jgi:diguanylate cyclase (GGDEF)-like protein
VSPSSARASGPPTPPLLGRRRSAVPAIVLLAGLAGLIVVLGGGGQLDWLSLPPALIAAALAPTRRGAAAAAGSVIGPAIITLGLGAGAGRPSLLLLVIVAAACVAVLVNVRERLERDRATLRQFALSDPVTRVANRRSLTIRADYEIARHRRTERSFALVMVDLDGFKALNDRFGHAAGDDLLREVAAALTRAMRAQDTVARFGGDEFCVLAPETDQTGADRLARRVDSAIRGVSVGMTGVAGSVGVAIYPDDGVTVAELMHAADARLLEAKRVLYRSRPARGARRRAA